MRFIDFAPHNLTADAISSTPASPFPYVTAASTSYFTGEFQPYKAFDGGAYAPLYYWVANASTGWISIYIGSDAKILFSYSIEVNSIPEPNRAPKDWTMEGSKDGATWVVLDTQTNQTSWGSGEVRNFVCDSSIKAYNFFRVNVTANNGDTYLAIAEIYLYEKIDYVSERRERVRSTGVSLGKYSVSDVRGTAANDVVASPTITGSASMSNPTHGFNSDLSTSAVVQSDGSTWIQIDFGSNFFIHYIRLSSGYGALSHTWLLERSTNGSSYTTIHTWSQPLYQYDWSPWFPVTGDARYIRLSKSAPNWLALLGMEVLLAQKPANYLIEKGRDRTRTRGISLGE